MDSRNYRNFGGRRKSLTNLILLVLEKAVDGTVGFNDFLNHPGPYGMGWDYPVKKPLLSIALKRLREKGWIDFTSDEQLIVKLTDTGREKAMLASLQQDDSPWDRKWRIVIFDIPEKRRVARNVLRYRLKQWGFKPWQQSVWVTKKNCTKPLREYIKKIGISDWVKVIESDNIS